MPLTQNAEMVFIFPFPSWVRGARPEWLSGCASSRRRDAVGGVFPIVSVLVVFSSEALTNTPYRDTGLSARTGRARRLLGAWGVGT